ncbi:MAG: hypothetical protein E5W72_08880 [Mesorhizobium sp.]|uniref:hypothetical protein n=1 Tax=Mesorhizobium sp. TaxID=1871066 RepID=UPI001224F0F3|nr:hypothetical protein [Mesorhizobium sp.]TIT01315.1 MAG: hypothetical protein E5W87_15555 [Mesorhizobium sp.]TIT52603.1 MAG: hypothetical protein E5W72_08880 [Mesorhizobium sp.]
MPLSIMWCTSGSGKAGELEATKTAIKLVYGRNAFRDKFLDRKLTTLFNLVRIGSVVVELVEESTDMTAKLDSEARRRIILDRYSKFGCTRTAKKAAEFRQGFHVPEQSWRSRARDCALIFGLLKAPVSESPYFDTRPSGSSAKKGPQQPRAAGPERFAQMLRPRFTRTCLSHIDLAICESVFDQVCANEHIDPLSRDAEALAVAIVAIFRNITTNERELLEDVRSFRRSKGSETAH